MLWGMKGYLSLLLLGLLLLTVPNLKAAEDRTWTSSDGQTLEGSLEEVSETEVRIRRVDGRTFNIPLERLSAEDQAYAQQVLMDQQRMNGFEEGPYAEAIRDEWVVFPADENGLIYQIYGSKKLSREDGPVPLYVYLHGAGARATEVEPGKVEPLGKRITAEDRYDDTPCVVLVPLCAPDVFWGSQVKQLEGLIDQVVNSLPIDRDRIYLAGYSMGARGVGSLIESRPSHYAVAAFADGEAKPEWAEKVTSAVWLWFSGERNMDGAQKTADAFEAAGKTVHLELFPDLTHNQIGYQMAQDEELYGWIFEQRRIKSEE